ncbi:hypothetical protein M758_9G006600 [Ceratodon purpureus]|uniref:Uncharacterized protein n=1 Tax=Ceratodon purpureus TaxID=3225 RepID=A0A8T0GUW0_CERPU|nr:hypothetical protein KC19_9G006900 [Ceratodon purpureus]KAG0604776.1 hypothetical protein M758_9G006600 [Ceratodon purpureus]
MLSMYGKGLSRQAATTVDKITSNIVFYCNYCTTGLARLLISLIRLRVSYLISIVFPFSFHCQSDLSTGALVNGTEQRTLQLLDTNDLLCNDLEQEIVMERSS